MIVFFCKRLLTKKIVTIIISTQTSIRGLFVTLARFFMNCHIVLMSHIVQWYWYLDNHTPRFLLFHQDLCLPILFFLILFFSHYDPSVKQIGFVFWFFTTQRNDKIKAILGESDFITIYWVFISMEGDRNNQSL